MSPVFQHADSQAAQERCADLVRRWLTACDEHSCFWSYEALAKLTDEQLADACIAAWRLDQPLGDENDVTWFEVHEADRTVLIAAFAAMRYEFIKAL